MVESDRARVWRPRVYQRIADRLGPIKVYASESGQRVATHSPLGERIGKRDAHRTEGDSGAASLDEVGKLENSITASKLSEREKFQGAKIKDARAAIVNGTAQSDAARWLQLSEQKQQELQEELMAMRDTLMDMSRQVDDKTRRGFSEDDSALSTPVIWLALFGLIFAATLLSLVR